MYDFRVVWFVRDGQYVGAVVFWVRMRTMLVGTRVDDLLEEAGEGGAGFFGLLFV